MSNGSMRILEGSQLRPVRRLRLGFGGLVLACVASLGGCHHATLHRGPDLHTELSTVTVDDLLFLAASYARSGDLLRAEQYLSAARQRGRTEPAVVYWLVRVCVAASRYQSALAHASSYLRDHPTDWSLRFVVATIYEALGYLGRAQSELERIVSSEPSMPLPHYRLAMLYGGRRADQERARAHLEEYLRLSPQGTHAEEVRSVLREADVAIAAGPHRAPPPRTVSLVEEPAP